MKKVLITGGFGFVGTLLAKHLLSKGIEVVVLEHSSAPVPKGLDAIQVIQADITSEESLAEMAQQIALEFACEHVTLSI